MRRSTRGASLIEAMVASVVVCVATASITTLLKYVGDASRRMTFQSAALDVYAEVAAQLDDARCNVTPDGINFDRDPGLTAILAAPNVWFTSSVGLGATMLRGLGDILPTAPNARGLPLNVSIRATAAPAWGPGTVGPPSYDFDVRIRELTGDPVRDAVALDNGYWIRVFPAKKVCNFRNDGTSRGETY